MPHILKRFQRFYKVIILVVDLFLIFASYILAFLIKFDGELPAFNFVPFLNASPYILIAAIIYLDMYKVLSFFRKSVYDVLKSIGLVAALLGITTIAVTYMLQGFSFPRTVLVLAPVIQGILLGTFNVGLLYLRRHMLGRKNVMIVCAGHDASDVLVRKIESFMKNDKIRKELVLDLSQQKIILRRIKDMDEIYLSSDIPAEFKAEIIRRCMGGKQVIYVVPQLFEISLINAKFMHLDDTPAFMVDILGFTAEQAFVKRMFDIAFSLAAIVVLSPLMLLTAALIKITSKGPVFYLQERMTKDNRCFTLVKFRTMRQDAEDLTGPVLSEVNDSRVTPPGRILRRTRIDELPQFFNVLKGDMSIVGPRPERPFFVEQFIHDLPEYEHRFSVKAGITGYAQIFGNYGTSPEDKLRYDLMYIRNYSLLLDIKLILQTIRVLFTMGSACENDGYSERTDARPEKTGHAEKTDGHSEKIGGHPERPEGINEKLIRRQRAKKRAKPAI